MDIPFNVALRGGPLRSCSRRLREALAVVCCIAAVGCSNDLTRQDAGEPGWLEMSFATTRPEEFSASLMSLDRSTRASSTFPVPGLVEFVLPEGDYYANLSVGRRQIRVFGISVTAGETTRLDFDLVDLSVRTRVPRGLAGTLQALALWAPNGDTFRSFNTRPDDEGWALFVFDYVPAGVYQPTLEGTDPTIDCGTDSLRVAESKIPLDLTAAGVVEWEWVFPWETTSDWALRTQSDQIPTVLDGRVVRAEEWFPCGSRFFSSTLSRSGYSLSVRNDHAVTSGSRHLLRTVLGGLEVTVTDLEPEDTGRLTVSSHHLPVQGTEAVRFPVLLGEHRIHFTPEESGRMPPTQFYGSRADDLRGVPVTVSGDAPVDLRWDLRDGGVIEGRFAVPFEPTDHLVIQGRNGSIDAWEFELGADSLSFRAEHVPLDSFRVAHERGREYTWHGQEGQGGTPRWLFVPDGQVLTGIDF